MSQSYYGWGSISVKALLVQCILCYIVAYRPVARQWQQNRWDNSFINMQCPVRNNGSSLGNGVFYGSALRLYHLTDQVELVNLEQSVKVVIHHRPPDLPEEVICNSLENLGFNIINVRQMMATRAPSGQTHVEPLSLFLVTLRSKIKSQEILRLINLNNTVIEVELYRAQTGLMQCYHCQNFGHVWANCKQPPWCLWCNDGYMHRECPEKTNTESMLSYCSCTLVGEKPHSMSYQGCSHVKAEEHNELPGDQLGGCSSWCSPHQGNPTQLHCVKIRNTSNYGLRRQMGEASGTPCSSICYNMKFRKQVSQ
jgi:hypothetical protein